MKESLCDAFYDRSEAAVAGDNQFKGLPGRDWIVLSSIIIGLIVASYAASNSTAVDADAKVAGFFLDFFVTALIYVGVGLGIAAIVNAVRKKKHRALPPPSTVTSQPATTAASRSDEQRTPKPEVRSAPPPPRAVGSLGPVEIHDRLRKVEGLLQRGAITEEEHAEQRRRILNEI